jgi:hypothetical protein
VKALNYNQREVQKTHTDEKSIAMSSQSANENKLNFFHARRFLDEHVIVGWEGVICSRKYFVGCGLLGWGRA